MTKILLVEDDKSLREIYGVRLLAEGYDIVSAGDGEEALAMAIKERPDLIVSDVMMPKISGFDMLDILRSTTETRDIKVIMMTALSSEDQRARGEALGADRYLVKSQVGIEDVVRTVHDVLGDAPVMAAAPNAFNAPTPSATPRPAAGIPIQPRQPAPTYTTPVEPSFAPTPQPVAQVAPQPQPTAQPQMPQPAPQFAQPQQQPQPQPQQQQPVAPQPAPWPQPQQQPQQQPQPAQSYMQQQPAQILQPQPIAEPQAPQPASSMPQPTAPFSTTRPANLGDRIIHPIQQERREGPDLSSLMDQELGRTDEQPAAPQQAEPAPQPAPSFEQPAPQPQPQPVPQPAPQPQSFEQPLPPVPPLPPTPDLSQLHGAQDIQFEETPRA